MAREAEARRCGLAQARARPGGGCAAASSGLPLERVWTKRRVARQPPPAPCQRLCQHTANTSPQQEPPALRHLRLPSQALRDGECYRQGWFTAFAGIERPDGRTSSGRSYSPLTPYTYSIEVTDTNTTAAHRSVREATTLAKEFIVFLRRQILPDSEV